MLRVVSSVYDEASSSAASEDGETSHNPATNSAPHHQNHTDHHTLAHETPHDTDAASSSAQADPYDPLPVTAPYDGVTEPYDAYTAEDDPSIAQQPAHRSTQARHPHDHPAVTHSLSLNELRAAGPDRAIEIVAPSNEVKVSATFWSRSTGSVQTSAQPSRVQKRKHQINSLAAAAAAQEAELRQRNSSNNNHRRKMRQLYGC